MSSRFHADHKIIQLTVISFFVEVAKIDAL